MTYQRCTRCVMDNSSDNTIIFDEHGHCNYCNSAISYRNKKYFPDGEDMLKTIVERIKIESKNKQYDCTVGLSGGLDSSYLLYIGAKLGLRMLAVHIDDGLDTDIAKHNIDGLCKAANVEIVYIHPNKEQYADLLLSFFKAGLPGVAIAQDNILIRALREYTNKYNIKYLFSGSNFALESILERSVGVSAKDKCHIKAVHNQFGSKPIDKLQLESITGYYLSRMFSPVKTIMPLNYIDYNKDRAFQELSEFSGFKYYGGKHHENVLTRFMQGYYLPVKFGMDKRKSHLSSLIIAGQMSREDALLELDKHTYASRELQEADTNQLAEYFGLSRQEFDKILELPAKQHKDYRMSIFEKIEPATRRHKIRKG